MKWGYHAVYEPGFEAAIDTAVKLNFDYVQFDLNVPRYYVHDLGGNRLNEIRAKALDSGVDITFHAPGDYVGLTMDIEPIRRGIIDHLKQIIDVAEYLDSHHLTLHPLSPPSFKRSDTRKNAFGDEYLDYYARVFAENLLDLDSHAQTVRLSVENQVFSDPVRQGLHDILPTSCHIGLTMDIPKLFSKSGEVDEDLLSFYRQYQDRIIELHVHDLSPGVMSHLEIGRGIVDFAPFLPYFSLDNVWVTIEVRPAEAAARSRDTLIEMLSRDSADR